MKGVPRWLLGLVLAVFAAPYAAEAAADGGHVKFGPLLFGIAVLVVAAKAGGLAAQRAGQPSVLGELLIGIGLGNLLLPCSATPSNSHARTPP